MRWLTLTTSSRCSNPVSYLEPLFWTPPHFLCPLNKDLQWTQLPRHIFAIFRSTSLTWIQWTTHGCYPKMENSSYSKKPSLFLTMQMSVWMSYDPTTTIALQGIQESAKWLVTSNTSSTGPDLSRIMRSPAHPVAEKARVSCISLSGQASTTQPTPPAGNPKRMSEMPRTSFKRSTVRTPTSQNPSRLDSLHFLISILVEIPLHNTFISFVSPSIPTS